MKKLALAALLAAGIAGASAQTAAAGTAGPCASVQALFDKYGIGLGMHQPEVEYVYGQVCQITG